MKIRISLEITVDIGTGDKEDAKRKFEVLAQYLLDQCEADPPQLDVFVERSYEITEILADGMVSPVRAKEAA